MNHECQVCTELIFYDEKDKRWKMRIQNSNWDHYNDSFDWEDFEINFCFECGKDYRNLKSGE